MEWFIYAILSGVFAGLYHFSVKSAAEYNHDSNQSTYYSMISAALMAGILFIFNSKVENFIILFLFALANSIVYYISTFSRIDSLKNIQTTLYYPIYKIINSTLVFFIGFFLFNETLNIHQLGGILVGLLTLLLLIQKKENNIQKNLRKGLFYLILSVGGGIGSATIGKYISISNNNIFGFIFISCTLMVFQGIFRYNKSKHKVHSIKFVKRISFLGGIASFLSYYFFLSSLQTGKFILVYMINSFSIIIVTLLSVIIYKDHLDKRKAFALLLTLISLFLLK
jgi:drug/metabolite transporter (DMT)-like permease